MGWLILLTLTALPVVEVMVWIKVADAIGGLATIGLTILVSAVGMAILRRQGLSLLLTAQARMREGLPPAVALIDGLLLSAAGVALVVPGFVTDGLAAILLLPPVRRLIGRRLARAMAPKAKSQNRPQDPTVIDAEYEIIEPDTKRLEPGRDP
jgi:UPF0716 protein FxsA